jgi:nucleoredoxin
VKARAALAWTLFGVLALGRPAAASSLAEIAADPQLWPAEVTVLAATKASVIKDGQPAGMMLVGAGKKLTVTGVAVDGVTGKLGGTMVKMPVEKTSLMQGTPVPPAPPTPPEPPARAEPAPPAPAAAGANGAPSAMQRLFTGKLVRYHNGKLQNVEPAALGGVKFYALYYSAAWCGPCRAFTPDLVTAYRELKAAHPEFELVFISADNSTGEMLGYMQEDRMPWPAVKYDRREQKMVEYSGPGIPCLVLVDAKGRVLADSYRGADYLGPRQALDATRRILEKGM